jgi:hypothetical protein
MASECRAACDAFRNRPGRQGGFFFRHSQQPNSSEPAFQAAAEGRGSAKAGSGGEGKAGHAKKRNG